MVKASAALIRRFVFACTIFSSLLIIIDQVYQPDKSRQTGITF
jgi:hypothetical protein